MAICYHGTPITPKAQLYRMAGQSFCVSFADARDADFCDAFGQSVLWDNGAFTAWTQKRTVDETALYKWLEPRMRHPHRAVIMDVIDGDVDTQREAIARWPFSRDLSWPVWHLDKPLDYLDELADQWPAVCFGSAGPYREIGSEVWLRKMGEAFDRLHRRRHLPWVHGLRMLGQIGNYPFGSADSTNVAQNYGLVTGCSHCMAKRVNSVRRQRGGSKVEREVALFEAI